MWWEIFFFIVEFEGEFEYLSKAILQKKLKKLLGEEHNHDERSLSPRQMLANTTVDISGYRKRSSCMGATAAAGPWFRHCIT
jgi:hypothetical protein